MKVLKKALAVITAVSALTASGIPVSAYDIGIGNNCAVSSGTDIVKIFADGDSTTEYSISDSGISIYQHSERNGIVFQLKKGADISSLGLKYGFEHKSSVYLMGWYFDFDMYYSSPYTSRNDYDADDFYVYLADKDATEEELIDYAKELAAKEGVLYADEFGITAYNNGRVQSSSRGNCCLYIHTDKNMSNEDMEKYVKKLNANKELTDYLESIGADRKITLDKVYKEPRISGIDDNTRIFEIMDELRAFDDIDSAGFICEMLCSNKGYIKFAECCGNNTEEKADTTEEKADAVIITDDSAAETIGVLPREKTDTIINNTDDNKSAPPVSDAPKEDWNVRDCAEIARAIANGNKEALTFNADYNGDGKVDIRDAAAIARDLAAKQ